MNNYSKIIAQNLKRLRDERNISLAKAADLTGVSRSMLAEIEKGTANPSILTLRKLTYGFKISFTELLYIVDKDVNITKLSDIEPLVEDKVHDYPIVLFDPVKRFETFYVEIKPHGVLNGEPHPKDTEEYFFIFSGSLELVIADTTYHLNQGDNIKFKADATHSYINNNNKPCQLYTILYYPG